MTLKRVGRDSAEDLRDSVEDSLYEAASAAMRNFLTETRRATFQAINAPEISLTAASEGLPTLGELTASWAQQVDAILVAAIEAAFGRVWRRWTDQDLELFDPSLSAQQTYLSTVRNRIVEGTFFGVTAPAEALDRIRVAMSNSVAEGWSIQQLAERIAVELDWAPSQTYWTAVKANGAEHIDAILDPLGPPGTPARETARENDPQVQYWRDQMNLATERLDAEESQWRTRSNLIARTESTGVANYGALQAMAYEGVAEKMWLATNDTRTRASHREADGEVVKLDGMFSVGGVNLMFPGDPTAPVHEVANCRCTMIAGDLD